MGKVRAGGEDQPPENSSTRADPQPSVPICAAAFKAFGLQVKLSVHGQEMLLRRESPLTKSHHFDSLAARVKELRVMARFRNKVFSYHEEGSFKLVGELEERLKDEIVISGLAVLVMIQSLNLAGMVLVWGSPN